ncbi:MAG: hypothetical protein E7Z85_08945 [Methanosphaera stadtmanae]|uniref:Uncharacterized protein n=1 Tax=Methanobrevibacter olleyae TaxID=294671 RepID=A0A8T3VZS7_METOL|nr:hypothetical protein [Methanosphaera stadtmanae]MBE6513446.1 hypothetical protein [Methanobrevibacter olleyae]
MIGKNISNQSYLISVVMGIFVGSVTLFVSRLIGIPITGVILAIVLSSFITAFVYNPSSKSKNTHTTIRGTSSSLIFSLIFAVMLILYYIPRLGSLFGTADISISVSIFIILFIAVIAGLVLGSISGTIGSTFRDLITIVSSEKKH